jgi:hypothetical protein
MLVREVFFLLSVLLLYTGFVSGQDCAELTINDLGSVSNPSQTGLLYDALALRETSAVAPIQIIRIHIVCLAQGSARDTYRSVSVVVEYQEGAISRTVQADFQCSNGVWAATAESVTDNPTATFTTPQRTDCINCIRPGPSSPHISGVDHCEGIEVGRDLYYTLRVSSKSLVCCCCCFCFGGGT